MPVSLPQIGSSPAPASTSTSSLQLCLGSKAEPGTFSSILDIVSQLLTTSGLSPLTSATTGNQTVSKGLQVSPNATVKGDAKSAAKLANHSPADHHEDAKAGDQPSTLALNAPDHDLRIADLKITPTLALPLATPVLASGFEDLSQGTQTSGAAAQSDVQPFGASMTLPSAWSGTANISGTTVLPCAASGLDSGVGLTPTKSASNETTESSAPAPAATETAKTVKVAAAGTTESAAATSVELAAASTTESAPATSVELAAAGTTESVPATSVELAAAGTTESAPATSVALATPTPIELSAPGTTGFAPATPIQLGPSSATGLATMIPAKPAAANTTGPTASSPNKLTVANAIPTAADTSSPLISTAPKTAPERDLPVPPAHTSGTIETHSSTDKTAPKPGPASEGVSFQAHRVNENPLNLSTSAAEAKTEIVNMLATAKDPQAWSGSIASDATSATQQPVQGQSLSTVVPAGQKTSADTQDAANSTHTSDDGAGSSKAQSQKDSVPAFTTTAVTTSTGQTELAQGALAGDGPGSTASVMQSALASSASKDTAAGATEKSPEQTAEPLNHTSTGAPEAHNSSSLIAYPTAVLSSAKLVERMGESELKLGIRAGEFGNVDIRTSMTRNQFTAEISVERGELGRVLAAELPSLHNRLSEQRIPIANIVLQNPSAGNSGTSEQQKSKEGQPAPSNGLETPQEETTATPNLAAVAGAVESGLRLDIHM